MLFGQSRPQTPAREGDEAPGATTAQNEPNAGASAEKTDSSARTRLNLLGQVDSASGEARRNENVNITLIDNNVLKELNQRMGTAATIVEKFEIERSYFGMEYGGSPPAPLHLPWSTQSGVHGEIHWSHNNSIFSARSFFQVGAVQPARTNQYGFVVSAPLWQGGTASVSGEQQKLRGQVNGNVLVPGASERTPTTRDPSTLAIVNLILAAYPDQLPNRTDINPRALNANAPQNINDDRITGSIHQSVGSRNWLMGQYTLTLQNIDAFQLVGGQNPDTTTRSHDARTTWTRTWSPATVTDFSIGFQRVGSLLVPDEAAPPTNFSFSRILESVGPGGNIPLDRTQNSFRYGARVTHLAGAHTLTGGADLTRLRINGSESNDHRGFFSFRRDFGRDLIGNILEGTPSAFRKAIGNAHRGFRNWSPTLYVGDEFRPAPSLALHLGVRYEPAPRPTEVNGLSEVPYDCDCNNVAPRFGFVYRAGSIGVLRGGYGVHFGEIFPATFMQARFNPPGISILNLTAPSLVDPLGSSSSQTTANRPDLLRIDPELATPYSHQYNLTWQLPAFHSWNLEVGYVGSRSHKLLAGWYTNRARWVDGATTGNVNDRRADSRFADIIHTLNGSRAYFDAGKITVRKARSSGLSVDMSYWWSKALDLGSNYANTAFGRDARQSRAPSESHVHERMRGPSDFDQSHALLCTVIYETPRLASRGGVSRILASWQVAFVGLLKTGTPFTVEAGSDAPDFGNVDGVSDDRPQLTDPSVLGASADHPDRSAASLPRSAFAYAPSNEEAGNLGRNTFRKDGIWNVNASVSRKFALRNDLAMHFRVESLNFFNHPQFAEPGTRLSEANFGQITNTLNEGRAFRFALRLTF